MSLALLAAGCGREEIRVYRVPKQTESPMPALANRGASGTPSEAASGIHWTAPAHWTVQPKTSMRAGSFAAKGAKGGSADISIIPIPGESGTELDNINRWRGQVGLGPVTEGELAALGAAVKIADQSTKAYDFVGTPAGKSAPERILVATATQGDTTWFFKITGDDDTVAGERAAFVTFLESVHFHADGDTSHAEEASSTAAAAASKWKIPASWTEVSPGMMQQAKFIAKGDGDAQAEATLSIFPGEAGGLLVNVNRWRRQIKLSPVTEEELQPLVQSQSSPSGPLTVLDLKNETDGQRLVAAILKRGSETWYFKITGDDAVVDRERAAFLRFAGQPQ
jgi:hypothetical protein